MAGLLSTMGSILCDSDTIETRDRRSGIWGGDSDSTGWKEGTFGLLSGTYCGKGMYRAFLWDRES